MHDYWFVQLNQRIPLPRWVLGIVLWLVLAGFFLWLFEVFSPPDAETQQRISTGIGLSLFFSLMIAYAITAASFVIDHCQKALDELRPELECSDQVFQDIRKSLGAASTLHLFFVATLGLGLGISHDLFMQGAVMSLLHWSIPSRIELGGSLGTILTWFVITHIISTFVRNAVTIARVGQDLAKIDLLNPQRLLPFGTIALMPALGIIGTQMLYPLLAIGDEFNMYAALPGFSISLASLVYLFIKPTWQIHKRLVEEKKSALFHIEADISKWQTANSQTPAMTIQGLATLQPLLSHRQYLVGLSEWPFNVSTLVRWGLYLIIPPLTWVGAALMENAIDQFVGV